MPGSSSMSPQKLTVLGVIPARLASERLPRKVLREIAGRPMLQVIYERSRKAGCLDELIVATDSEEILSFCERNQIPAMLTSPAHTSGTDRIAEVSERKEAEVYVTIQGDEPLVRPEHIEAMVDVLRQVEAIQVSTLKVAISRAQAADPSVVKVVTDPEGYALYFSRHPIPFPRGGDAPCFKHLGFYAYRRRALQAFHRLAPTPLEQVEKLEQLRFLENRIPIYVADTEYDAIGVDTEEDLRRVEKFFTEKSSQ